MARGEDTRHDPRRRPVGSESTEQFYNEQWGQFYADAAAGLARLNTGTEDQRRAAWGEAMQRLDSLFPKKS